jgi:hypothetical protein
LKAETVTFDELDSLSSNWLKNGSECVGHWWVLHGYLVFFDSNNYKF